MPSQQAGRDFLLESFPQIMAYRYMIEAQALTLNEAMNIELQRYCYGINQLGLADLPLVELTDQSYLAYHQGAYLLLQLDQLLDGQLLIYIAKTIQSFNESAVISASQYVELLLSTLPQQLQDQAKNTFYNSLAANECT